MTRKPHGRRAAEIQFRATIQAHQLRFGQVPKTQVQFRGDSPHDSESGNDRTNLPDKVDAHVTYHSVEIDHRIVSQLRDRG